MSYFTQKILNLAKRLLPKKSVKCETPGCEKSADALVRWGYKKEHMGFLCFECIKEARDLTKCPGSKIEYREWYINEPK